MKPRLKAREIAPNAFSALHGVDRYLATCGLETSLLHLVKLRASQINGCAYCIDMHCKDLRALGESEQRLYSLTAWRDTPFYTDRERAALAWTETLTLITAGHVSDQVYEDVGKHFSESELVDLTVAVVAINGWNRMSIAFRAVPGAYQPATAAANTGTVRS